MTRKFLKEGSIYKGKAVRVNWEWRRKDLDFNPNAHAPQFLDLGNVKEDELIFSSATQRIIDIGLFIPIEKSEACRAAGIPLKRGVLLEGTYGVGKTLTAYVTAAKAVRHGWTFIYCDDIQDLADAIQFAHAYQPAVIFAEDVDRVMAGERDLNMDEVLNIIDGIESKNCELITVLTTNDIDEIEPALLRPGRLDAVVSVQAPDAAAARRLVQLYGRGLLAPGINLEQVGEALAGKIPAVIREVVERAKIAAIQHATNGISNAVTDEDLLSAASAMKAHMDLLTREEEPQDPMTAALDSLVDRVVERLLEIRVSKGPL